MSAFSVRSRGYQMGLLLLFVSTFLFLIGLVSPMWLEYEREVIQIHVERLYAGVFIGCQYKLRLVGATSFEYTRCSFGFAGVYSDMPRMGEWVHAVETFEILSAVALIFACIYGATINCFTIYPAARTRILELISGIAGTVAFIFAMVFVGKLRKTVEGSVFYTFEWAFYLSVVASIAVVVAAFIIALFNEYIPPPSDFNFSNVTLASKPVPPAFSSTPSVVYSVHRDGHGGGEEDDDMYDSRVSKVILDEEAAPDEPAWASGGRRRGSGGRGGGRRRRSFEGPGRYESDL